MRLKKLCGTAVHCVNLKVIVQCRELPPRLIKAAPEKARLLQGADQKAVKARLQKTARSVPKVVICLTPKDCRQRKQRPLILPMQLTDIVHPALRRNSIRLKAQLIKGSGAQAGLELFLRLAAHMKRASSLFPSVLRSSLRFCFTVPRQHRETHIRLPGRHGRSLAAREYPIPQRSNRLSTQGIDLSDREEESRLKRNVQPLKIKVCVTGLIEPRAQLLFRSFHLFCGLRHSSADRSSAL